MALVIHILLFLCIAFAIVLASAFYADGDDAPAFASLPRRMLSFCGGCALVAAIILVCEHTFARIT